MRRWLAFLLVQGALLFLLTVLLVWGGMRQASGPSPATLKGAGYVRDYGLTDLCLFTEARYTRHPSQADLHSAFQDHPGAMEHFPTGSLIAPPTKLWMKSHALP